MSDVLPDTITTAIPTVVHEEELNELYDKVWKVYAADAVEPTSAVREGYGVEPSSVTSPTPSRIVHDERPPMSATSSTSKRSFRPLPPTPGSPSSASTSTFHMSGFESFRDSKHQSSDSYVSSTDSAELLAKATGLSSGRRLPVAPGSANGANSPFSYRSPSHIDSPGSSTSRDTLEYWNSSDASSNGIHSPSLPRQPSSRPSGASAPTIPGQSPSSQPDGAPRNNFDIYEPEASTHPITSNDSSSYLRSPLLHSSPLVQGYVPATSYTDIPSSGFDTNQIYGNSDAGPSYSNIQRGNSAGSYVSGTDQYFNFENSSGNVPGPSNVNRRPTDVLNEIGNSSERGPLGLHYETDDDGYWEDEEEDDETRFVNFSLLSHIAVQLRDKVPRGTHVKGSIPYPRAFTGKDIVSTIQAQIQRELAINHGLSTSDRRAALQVARSLQSQLFFYEVEWGGRVLQDGVEDVYMFLDDQDGPSDATPMREELPTGVITVLTKCYSPSCGEGTPCYTPRCPRNNGDAVLGPTSGSDAPSRSLREAWSETVPREVIISLPESEISRQTIIHKLISKEEQYLQDLDIVDTVFIKPLRMAHPPVIPQYQLDDFIDDVFGNILDLRECNRRLLEVLYVRQREQYPVIQRIGDVFLEAATEFRLAYPIYIGHHPVAEKRMKDELETNPEFRLFVEHASRQTARPGETMRLDLKHYLNRPSEHLQKYPVLLEAIHKETVHGNPDGDYLTEAIDAINNLQSVAQLRTFQSAMGRGVTGKLEWHNLVADDIRKSLSKQTCKRQSIIFELIKGEMTYVKDLENIENMYIRPLRNADPPIIPPDRLDQFITDVFHNFAELHAHHLKLVETLHEIQREEHPVIRTVTAAVFDAALNFRDAYMEYIPNYPIAKFRIDDEMANNEAFKNFVDQCVRHPDAHRLDMKSFVNRPIPRLLRYELLLKGILDETHPGHDDCDEIPQVLEVIKALGKDAQPGVVSAEQKVELWRYNSNIVFKPGEAIDMDLLNENRSLIHTGKLLRQPDSGLEWNGWSELSILLFDNYFVMTKPREKDGVVKYHVNRRPIPLDLLTLVNFTDPPTQRSTGLLRTINLRGGDRHAEPSSASGDASDSRSVFPCTIHHNGRLGGPYILYAESAQVRSEWKQKLEEALGLRKVVQESNKVFEVETLSTDTFLVPAMMPGAPAPAWNQDNSFTGKVTCSVPFNTPDGRALVAVGCAEGVWIGFRHDSRSMRCVLYLKMVTQCAMLEDFGIFLVLADKSLFAYHIEALVPSSPQSSQAPQTPQKLNGTKDVHYFSVGNLHGRTLVIYMKKKGLESHFHVVEPVVDKINDRTKVTPGFSSRFGFRAPKSDWFREYRDFFIPSESFDLIFLKAKIAILCTKGFEIMDLMDLRSVTIPQREDPRLAPLIKRLESCRPLGMFRSTDDEFLLCYDEFGLHVNKHGDPSRSTGTIEWEGTAERVALHAPYILLFDSRFIEIRHLRTGRLAQIIPGNDMHCVWDGRGVNSGLAFSPGGTDGDDEHMVQEARVHGVMNSEPVKHVGGKMPKAVAQHVFELIPTIPLYLPGSLASPSTMTYFPSFSPPHSPHLRPSNSYRPSY